MPRFQNCKTGDTYQKKGTREQKLSWDPKDWSVRKYVEADLQKFILSELNSMNGVYARAVKKGNQNGIPDIICCVKGRYVAMELKVDSQPTIQQLKELEAITDAHGVCDVVKCWKDVRKLLKKTGYPMKDI